MGTCGSHQIEDAIKRDGPQNVKKGVISRAGQRQATRYYEELTKKFPDYLRDKEQLKMKYIDKKKDDLEERVKEIHRKLQTQSPNSVQKLQKKNNKSFKQIVGYNKTQKDIETYRSKVRKIFSQQQTKLNKDLKAQQERTVRQLSKEEPQLKNLTRFGVSKKDSILKDQQSKYKNEIESNNQKIREKIDSEIGLNKAYKDRFEQKIPNSELNQILEQFQQNVPSSASIKPGCCS